ncbi:MAG: transcriptional regulator GlxA family with amidase domain [Oleispira sp.]|jgi:transcriptional regulator GlxA family with amidase domain
MSVGDWLLSEKLQRSQELLESTELPINLVADQVDFTNATSLRMHFKKRFNVTPNEWRKILHGFGKEKSQSMYSFT